MKPVLGIFQGWSLWINSRLNRNILLYAIIHGLRGSPLAEEIRSLHCNRGLLAKHTLQHNNRNLFTCELPLPLPIQALASSQLSPTGASKLQGALKWLCWCLQCIWGPDTIEQAQMWAVFPFHGVGCGLKRQQSGTAWKTGFTSLTLASLPIKWGW